MTEKAADKTIDIGLSGRKKVLVAEDEQNIASLIEDWLSETYDVILAYNGAAALQKAKWNQPDVVLMDVIMPDTGGYEVVCALQGDPVTSKIPVIVMTAKNFDDSTVKLIKAEPNVLGFLNKPFKPDELKKQIAQVMTGQRTFQPPTSSRRGAGAPRPAAAPPAAAPPVPTSPPRPTSPPPPAAPVPVLPVAAPPPPALPPMPATVLAPPPPPPPAPASPPPAPMGIVYGFPEIVPTSPLPPAPLPSATPPPPAVPTPPPAPRPAPPAGQPLPPFLRSAPLPPPPPAPAPQIRVEATPPPVSIEPTSALPPVPQKEMEEKTPAISMPLRESVMPDIPSPSPAPTRRPPPKPQDLDEGGGESSVFLLKSAAWVLKALLMAGVLVGGFFGTGEMVARWAEESLGRELFVPPLRPSRIAGLPYALAPSSLWRRGGVEYSISPWGVRGGDVSLIKPPNTVRIFILGGTSLFGEGLAAGETVPERLQRMLTADGGRARYEVINGGLWGFSPEEQWTFYERAVAELKPDVLIWFVEEKVGGFPSAAKLKDVAQNGYFSSTLFDGSRLAGLLRRRKMARDAGSRRTDFLALVSPAAQFAQQNDAKFLYAVAAARVLDPSESRELPDKGRIELDDLLRESFMASPARASAHEAVARILYERLQALKKPGGKKI